MKSKRDLLITVTDSQFIKGTQIMLYSFLTHNPWFQGDIIILSDENIEHLLYEKISFASYFRFEKVSPELIEKVEALAKGNTDYIKNKKTFYSLESFRFSNYKNILFVDSDILFKASILELKKAKQSFLAVGDKPYYKDLARLKNDFSSRVEKGVEQQSLLWNDSLNSGLFIIKTDILPKDIYQKILASISVENFKKFNGNQHDQFIIFLHFKELLHLISAKFNYRFQIAKEIKTKDKVSYRDAAVIHFTGLRKPWHSIHTLLDKLTNWQYAHAYIHFKITQIKAWRRNLQLKNKEKQHYKKLKSLAHKNLIDTRQTDFFCLFVGYPRSGHTLVGALLDAHPNAAIATELDAFDLHEKGFSKSEIFALIAERSKEMRNNKYMWTDYSYAVPNQHQGNLEEAQVIGVKHGGKLSNILKKDIHYISKFKDFAPNLKLIHITRNPFDIITTRVTRQEKKAQQKMTRKGILEIMDFQFAQMEIIGRLKASEVYDIFDLSNEDFIDQPKLYLKNLCAFLSLSTTEDYLNDCASIVFKKPTQTRFKVDWWDNELKEVVQKEMNKYPHFSHYSFEGSKSQSDKFPTES